MGSLSLINKTRQKVPAFPFARAARRILPRFDLSLAFITETDARALNHRLRRKSYVPNVLSYKTGVRSGEVIICLSEAKRQARTYDLTYPAFVGLLFIHACLHLNGKRHSNTMERSERALLARLLHSPLPNGPSKNRNRHRHRNAPRQGRSR